MVDACATYGIYPYYGPFGDITDVVACEDQFRNAFLLGCVGAWSLHPVQIGIAKKVFSPPVDEVLWAKKVIAEMGPMPGARDFLDWLRPNYQVLILSDTFYEFAMPLMKPLPSHWGNIFFPL